MVENLDSLITKRQMLIGKNLRKIGDPLQVTVSLLWKLSLMEEQETMGCFSFECRV